MSAIETAPVAECSAERSLARRVAQLLEQHGSLGRLCDDLESIADALPRACPKRCRRAAAELETLVPGHHAFEAAVLDDLLSGTQSDLLDRIMRQHAEDEGLAFEIALALEPIGAGTLPEHAETLGYMLRCFFNNCRRSMLVEELALQSAAPAMRLGPTTGADGGRP